MNTPTNKNKINAYKLYLFSAFDFDRIVVYIEFGNKKLNILVSNEIDEEFNVHFYEGDINWNVRSDSFLKDDEHSIDFYTLLKALDEAKDMLNEFWGKKKI